jgi:hypothetical protein
MGMMDEKVVSYPPTIHLSWVLGISVWFIPRPKRRARRRGSRARGGGGGGVGIEYAGAHPLVRMV